MPFIYKIARVIGNSLPHRDSKKIKSIEYVLKKGYCPEDVEQVWFLNKLRDCSESEELRTLLKDFNQKTVELPFSRKKYNKAKSREEKIKAFIGINKARNFALSYCKPYDWLFVLDDTNFFNKKLWKITTQDIERHTEELKPKYFAVPIIRFKPPLKDYDSIPLQEPILAFNKKAPYWFDDTIEFGRGDKVELLLHLGCVTVDNGEGSVTMPTHENKICPRAGKILHVSFSPEEEESLLENRERNRRLGLDAVINELDQ